MKNPNMTQGDLVPNKVEVKLNVLRSLMLYRVAGEVNGRYVVSVDNGRTAERTMKL